MTPETLNAYFAAGTPTLQTLSVDPHCWLRIDPIRDELQLFTPETGDLPDLVAYERLKVNLDEMDGLACYRVDVEAGDARYEGYSFIAAVVDAMKSGKTLAAAVQGALRTFMDLLAKRRRLTPEREQGLIGELLLFSHLLDTVGEHEAMQAWLGPQSEEHDFVLATCDVEVKTTLSEKRVHMINSAMQLQPSPRRVLWLISIQLTKAGAADESVSLTGLVDNIRPRLGGGRESFDEYLRRLGWRDDDVDLYRTKYMLRSQPAAYLVDEEFPAITRPRIDIIVPQSHFVGAISYRIDVSSLPASVPPQPLTEFAMTSRGEI
ncbi:PD-(D/E)XK motif protein [Rhodococcus sp. D-6]|uniref:PD-(D/E)XK motif protein n=2 Tax=unclassified Rhodococcus (in: high G+C Gram-positive bacteria) TaxID=192944 RepID=A0AAU7UZ24_9NOCA